MSPTARTLPFAPPPYPAYHGRSSAMWKGGRPSADASIVWNGVQRAVDHAACRRTCHTRESSESAMKNPDFPPLVTPLSLIRSVLSRGRRRGTLRISMVPRARELRRLRSHTLLAGVVFLLAGGGATGGCKADSKRRSAPDSTAAGSSAGGAAGEATSAVVGGTASAGRGGSAGAGDLSTSGSAGTATAGSTSTATGGLGAAGFGTAGFGMGGEAGGPTTLATGAECVSDAECSTADLCVTDVGAVSAVCRPRCEVGDIGQVGVCAEGELCALDSTFVQASCHRVCVLGPSGAQECSAAEGCRVHPDVALTGGDLVSGLCVRSGSEQQGMRCTDGDCAEGLECISQPGAVGYCSPFCDPTAATGEFGACSDSATCELNASGRSACVERCSLFGEGDCSGDNVCVPDGRGSAETGRCVQAGALQQGEPCAPGDCAGGLLCSPAPTPFAGMTFTCEPICSMTAAEACQVGECVQERAVAVGIGTCRQSCALLENGAAAGCSVDQWCAPTSTGANIGVCVPVQGDFALGAECASSRECGPALYCECQFGVDSGCFGVAQCDAICIPGAAASQPGGCPTGQECAFETDAGIAYAFGTCRPGCDFVAGESCADAEQSCSPAPFSSVTSGVCLDIPQPYVDIGEPCRAPQLNIHEHCAPSGICELDPSSGETLCLEICRGSEGAIGESLHPDCSNASSTCVEIDSALAFGYCSVDS